MIDQFGRWYPDFPGQQMYQDPMYIRNMRHQPQAMQPQQPSVQQIQQPTIQQSGFVLVPSEQEARNYPVAPGNSVTFKDENAPYCYVKTMGFNQLDRPSFERYRLVKEDAPQEAQSAPQSGEQAGQGSGVEYALKSDVDALRDELEAVKEKLTAKPAKKVKEVADDDAE